MIEKIINLSRSQKKLDNGLSTSLQVGKAAEHLACASLLLQGYNAFLSEAGLPYDILVDHNGKFHKIQVKSTCKMIQSRPKKNGATYLSTYRFAIRKGRVMQRKIKLDTCDFLALVALDIKAVAFVPTSMMNREDGYSKQCIELKTRRVKYDNGKAGPDPNKFCFLY
jgi:hypothetical protein